MIDVLNRITELRLNKKWTEYQLSVESGLPQSTISSWYRKNLYPTIPSLYKICEAFNITLSDFFNENSNVTTLTTTQSNILKSCRKLSKAQQEKLVGFINSL